MITTLKMYFANLARIALVFACLQLAGVTWADTVLTREGKTLKGKIELVANGVLKIGDAKVPLGDLIRAKFHQPPTSAQTDELTGLTNGMWAVKHGGALCWNGTFIARKVVAMDDTKVTFENSTKELFLSSVNVSAIFFGEISLTYALKLRAQKQPGVLLASGDFVEGRLKHIAEGSMVVDSILFGRKTFALGTEAVVLWLRKPKPMAARFTLRTRDGSVLLVKKPHFNNGALVLDGSPFRSFRVKQNELVEIRNGDAVDVLTFAWAKVDNAVPEKKALLLFTVENVGKTLELRKKIQLNKPKLREAMKVLAKAEAAKAGSSAKRQRVLQEWKQLQNVWRQKNREYWKTHSNKLRMTSQARTKQSAVVRAERTLKNAGRTLERYNNKLVIFEKGIAQANAKPQKDVRRKRDSFMRPIERAKRAMQSAQQKLNATHRDNEKVQAETKPLPDKEKNAKRALDRAKKDTDQAMLIYRKATDEYRVVSRQADIARSKVAELQQAKDQATQELEKLRSNTPAIEPRK
jgi:hypothetical protein